MSIFTPQEMAGISSLLGDLLSRPSNAFRQEFATDLERDQKLYREVEDFTIAWCEFAVVNEGFPFNELNIRRCIDNAISVYVSHWLRELLPDNDFHSMSKQDQIDADQGNRTFHNFCTEYQRFTQSGGQRTQPFGNTGFGNRAPVYSGGTGVRSFGQGQGASQFFSSRPMPTQGSFSNAGGAVNSGLSSRIGTNLPEPKLPVSPFGHSPFHQPKQPSPSPFTSGDKGRFSTPSVREEVAAFKQANPTQQEATVVESKMFVEVEVVYMDENQHRTAGLLKPRTMSDTQVRLFDQSTTEQYFERASAMNNLRSLARGNEDLKVYDGDDIAIDEPINLGIIIDTDPSRASILELMAKVATRADLKDKDYSEAPLFAIRNSFHPWGLPVEVCTPNITDYVGRTHMDHVEHLATLEEIIPPHEYRTWLNAITDRANEWLDDNGARFEMESYVLDAIEVAEGLKNSGNVSLKRDWLEFARELHAYLKPVKLSGNGLQEAYYFLHSQTALVKMPMRAVQLPLGLKSANPDNIPCSGTVTALSTPNLHRFLMSWYDNSNACDRHTILFEDGRSLGMHMDASGQPELYTME